jgi:hypothetical protein
MFPGDNGKVLEVDAREALRSVTIKVKLTHCTEVRARLWLGTRLIKLAAWVLDCSLEFLDDGKRNGQRDGERELG